MYGPDFLDYGARIGGSVMPPLELTNEDDPAEGGARFLHETAPLSALPMEMRGTVSADQLRLEGGSSSRIPRGRSSIAGGVPPTQTTPIQGRGAAPMAPTGKGPQFGSLGRTV